MYDEARSERVVSDDTPSLTVYIDALTLNESLLTGCSNYVVNSAAELIVVLPPGMVNVLGR